MGPLQTVVCVKQVKQESVEEWDETMPLPGDIIEGVAEDCADESFISAKIRSEFNSVLGKINRGGEYVWLKVRRGESTLKLQACVVQDRDMKLHKKFTVRAASDERHIAVLADMTYEKCFQLQEMSRRVVNLDFKGFQRKGMRYDWKSKVGIYLPDRRCTVVSSILFTPLRHECGIEAPTVRAMAWFSAAVSSGIPLVFLNIQTEQIITSENKPVKGKELTHGRQQIINTTVNIVQGIRLWFLPGVSEVSLVLIPGPGETRFGMDMKRTEEGFICLSSVTNGTAAERAGIQHLLEQANRTNHLLVISRLQGKSLMPSTVDLEGYIHCCDNAEIKQTIVLAMENAETIQIHLMSWPNQTPRELGAATLRPPN
ncbi:uncharacterized protein [Primulina huaijiensis]|uniref:uncharacterized protein isoform X1 n=2 Tax=Primulina huaijiensis TaxID=1492673 RepID=UPI003CC73050